jgi:hypothetical protein
LLRRSLGRFGASADDTYFLVSANPHQLVSLEFSVICDVFYEIPLLVSCGFFLSGKADHFTDSAPFSIKLTFSNLKPKLNALNDIPLFPSSPPFGLYHPSWRRGLIGILSFFE